MKKWLTAILLLSWSMAFPAWAADFPLPPAPQNNAYVQDFADVLETNVEQAILQQSAQLDQLTGAQVVVVTVPSLEDRPVEEYSNELFRSWGLGKKGEDNGVLLLVAPKERKVRIEVGYGLEGRIPDGLAGRILDEHVLPHFRKNNYSLGVWQGYRTITDLVAKEYNVQLDQVNPEVGYAKDNANVQQVSGNLPWWVPFLVVGLIILDFIFFRGFLTRTIFDIILWSMIFRGGGRGGGDGGFGGFGGGSSGGGGSSRDW